MLEKVMIKMISINIKMYVLIRTETISTMR